MTNNSQSPKKRRGVTIMDVARASGVSYATVSRVLSGYEFVKASTRHRVMEAVEQLGYVANLQARSLAGGRSRIIGLLVPNLDNGYIGTIMRGIDQELERANYDLMLYTTHRQPDNESFYVNAIANGLTEGLLLVTPLVATTYLKVLREHSFPYVLIDQVDGADNSSSVSATNWQGAYEATQHLIELGHRRIAFITGALVIQSAVDRLQGYKAALADSGIPIRDELILEGDYLQRSGYEISKNLLQSAVPLPTAIFASNDLSAFGAMDAARECGLRIPDDISVIGFDDIPQASLVYPKLTTVGQPLEQMGKVAVKMLLEQIEGRNHQPRRVTLATQLVLRDSCGSHQVEGEEHSNTVKRDRRKPIQLN
ncbi:MAG: LacI family DNA-binding transcriptional regulator [Anaerolineae bacterium]|nr:LacI family DNA-binding transcriptional regulator [Anaerolineae bacterium]